MNLPTFEQVLDALRTGDLTEVEAGYIALMATEGRRATAEQLRLELPASATLGGPVPVRLICSVPGTERMALFVQGASPFFIGAFFFTQGTAADITTRVKVEGTGDLIAIALTPDGLLVATGSVAKPTVGTRLH